MNDTYKILRPLGKGGTSDVYLGYHNNLKKYIVIKKLKGKYTKDIFNQAEVEVLKNLTHQYLPMVYDYLQIYNPQRMAYDCYTVIDYVDGVDLGEYLKSGYPFTEEQLKRWLRQVAQVLEYLHELPQPVYHCDIKPENIMITREGNVKLIDFNTAIGPNQCNLLGLTAPYASPEQCDMASGAFGCPEQLDGRSDLYSLGATFYVLISGRFPNVNAASPPLHTMGLKGYSHDFLVLIDRLMAKEREQRLKSAKRLLAAIDRLDNRYWLYFTMRCVSLLVSAAFISFGLYFLIRGTQLKPVEAFRREYLAVVSSVQRGDLEMAQSGCMEILTSEQMQKHLSGSQADQARLYHTMGDIHYYAEEYSLAAAYYSNAVNLCGGCTEQERSAFVRDAAIAYAQMGDLPMAKAYLQAASGLEGTGTDTALIDIVIAQRSGDSQGCISMARELLAATADPQLCFRAAQAAAAASTSPDEKISWLGIAASYDSGKTTRRGLAMAWAEKARQTQNASDRQEAWDRALEYYEALCTDTYASTADRINYSVVLRELGRDNQALQVLQTACQYDPENYRLLANLAALYYEIGNSTEARRCCDAALRLWRADASATKLDEGSEVIQNLMEISRRLGTGG